MKEERPLFKVETNNSTTTSSVVFIVQPPENGGYISLLMIYPFTSGRLERMF